MNLKYEKFLISYLKYMELLFTITNEEFDFYAVFKDIINSHVDTIRADIL